MVAILFNSAEPFEQIGNTPSKTALCETGEDWFSGFRKADI